MRITCLGHAGFLVESEATAIVDPFLTGNPKAGFTQEQIEEADLVLVTHSHPDHVGESFPLLVQGADALRDRVEKESSIEVAVFQPGETRES